MATAATETVTSVYARAARRRALHLESSPTVMVSVPRGGVTEVHREVGQRSPAMRWNQKSHAICIQNADFAIQVVSSLLDRLTRVNLYAIRLQPGVDPVAFQR